MNRIFFTSILIFFFSFGLIAQENENSMQLLGVQKIWDKAPHNAFTDLIRFQNNFYCVFREGTKHVSPDGAVQIITSPDGIKWESAARITSPNSDLRDAKITCTPNNELMLSGAEALHDKSKNTHQSLAWFSKDGINWSKKHEIGDPDFWLWRTVWHNKNAYNFGYGCGENNMLRLYKSYNGKIFETHVENLNIEGYPNETSIVFKGDTAFCLLRRDGDIKTALFGISVPPYKIWEWKNLGVRIGGPQMILLPDGRLIAAVRLYDSENWNPARTSLCWIDAKSGKLTEALKLPSGGDTSYAGMVVYNGILWVSYYSSHEGKTSIYLAKVKIENTNPESNKNVIKKFQSDANQGVAVDENYYYAISNLKISKHDKSTGRTVTTWQADTTQKSFKHFLHMNSGTVINGKLYVAHSRYKIDSNNNSVEIWNVGNTLLEHEKTISMPRKHGSLTWVDKQPDDSWWMCYAVYGEEFNRNTKLVKYQYKKGNFIEINNWTFPKEVTDNWEDMSCSGGSWGPDGLLYTTGHDHEKAFVLGLNERYELEYRWTENDVGFFGQAIAWDRFSITPQLWGIVKRKYITVTLFPGE